MEHACECEMLKKNLSERERESRNECFPPNNKKKEIWVQNSTNDDC